jgi:hypothetical protein
MLARGSRGGQAGAEIARFDGLHGELERLRAERPEPAARAEPACGPLAYLLEKKAATGQEKPGSRSPPSRVSSGPRICASVGERST